MTTWLNSAVSKRKKVGSAGFAQGFRLRLNFGVTSRRAKEVKRKKQEIFANPFFHFRVSAFLEVRV